jgi:hypothetical protein
MKLVSGKLQEFFFILTVHIYENTVPLHSYSFALDNSFHVTYKYTVYFSLLDDVYFLNVSCTYKKMI